MKNEYSGYYTLCKRGGRNLNIKVELLILSQFGFTEGTLYRMYEEENNLIEIIYNKRHPFYNKYFDTFTDKEKALAENYNVLLEWIKEFKLMMKKYKEFGIKILYRFDIDFPLHIFDKDKIPLFLYCYGDLSLLERNKKRVAIIGTRKPSNTALNATKLHTNKYVDEDYIVVSGLALGIDTVAHKETLINNGKTIAVLPSSFEKVYPKENEGLFNEIIQHNGLIITTIGPFENTYKSNFLDRNSMVANLCTEVFLIEAVLKSGSLNTVRKASNKEKKIMYDSLLLDDNVKEYLVNLGAIDSRGGS